MDKLLELLSKMNINSEFINRARDKNRRESLIFQDDIVRHEALSEICRLYRNGTIQRASELLNKEDNFMQREISRLKNYIDNFPDIEIWSISNTNLAAEAYWQSIKEYIKTDKKPRFISKGNFDKDGSNTFNAIVLLCGHWYENPIAFSGIFRMHLSNARFTLPIGEIPVPKALDKYRLKGFNPNISIIDECAVEHVKSMNQNAEIKLVRKKAKVKNLIRGDKK